MNIEQAMTTAKSHQALLMHKAEAAEVLAAEVERLREVAEQLGYQLTGVENALALANKELAETNDKLEKAFAHAANISESAVMLLGQRDELMKDAARYRWLCANKLKIKDADSYGPKRPSLEFSFDYWGNKPEKHNKSGLDETIDAAITAKGE